MTQVLDLDAALVRAEIKWGGNTYALRNHQELSLVQLTQLSNYEAEIIKIRSAAGDSEEDVKRLAEFLHAVVELIVVDPPEAGFPDQQAAAIIGFWRDNLPAVDGDADPRKSRPTGAATSRGSKRSTAAIRKPGSTSRSGR